VNSAAPNADGTLPLEEKGARQGAGPWIPLVGRVAVALALGGLAMAVVLLA
jgi:hypothetical protein